MTRFFLLYDPKDQTKPFRVVGGERFKRPWKFDSSFATEILARDQVIEWICAEPDSEFHDMTR